MKSLETRKKLFFKARKKSSHFQLIFFKGSKNIRTTALREHAESGLHGRATLYVTGKRKKDNDEETEGERALRMMSDVEKESYLNLLRNAHVCAKTGQSLAFYK